MIEWPCAKKRNEESSEVDGGEDPQEALLQNDAKSDAEGAGSHGAEDRYRFQQPL